MVKRIGEEPKVNEASQDVMFEENNKYKNSDIHRAVYYLNKGPEEFRAAFPGQSFQDILDKNIDKINSLNEQGQSPIALCTTQAMRRELVRYGADPKYAIIENDKSKPAKKEELEVIHQEYKDVTEITLENTLNVVSEAFNQSKSAEEFTNSIMKKFEKMYQMEGTKGKDKLKAHEESIKEQCKATYANLKVIKDNVEKKPIMKKFYEILCKALGKNDADKVMKDNLNTAMIKESQKMHAGLKEIQGALRNHGAEVAGTYPKPLPPSSPRGRNSQQL